MFTADSCLLCNSFGPGFAPQLLEGADKGQGETYCTSWPARDFLPFKDLLPHEDFLVPLPLPISSSTYLQELYTEVALPMQARPSRETVSWHSLALPPAVDAEYQ